eukprot:TRINITY_DN3612_c1_g2_i1.p1 TRINITY_DN3612_c1_g2~~TRINITY_DN3612_c1_g2_i1.p1  ORF type:complete len:111 (+),score=21.13 TRINITY_DN3612_c1_g2_i1:7-339(+)
MVDKRVHYRRRSTYRTASNKHRLVKTPGGRLVIQIRDKRRNDVKCGDCRDLLRMPRLSSRERMHVSKTKKTISRAYGGSRCANCVSERILRAFIVEEVRAVKEKKKMGRK